MNIKTNLKKERKTPNMRQKIGNFFRVFCLNIEKGCLNMAQNMAQQRLVSICGYYFSQNVQKWQKNLSICRNLKSTC